MENQSASESRGTGTPFVEIASPALISITTSILDSYRRFFGRKLLDERQDPDVGGEDDEETFTLAREARAKTLYEAPFVVLAHGMEEDPLFIYANQAAQRLFQQDWYSFVGRPSRTSAEPQRQADRAELLAEVEKQGYASGYNGVRTTATGLRFRILDGTLWTLTDEQGGRVGIAATFARSERL